MDDPFTPGAIFSYVDFDRFCVQVSEVFFYLFNIWVSIALTAYRISSCTNFKVSIHKSKCSMSSSVFLSHYSHF